MEKAIEIKRRAQRCIQSGDLDGALTEYEKLVASEESDPYHFVLFADLLFKKGEPGQASKQYLRAVEAYERAGLFKNAIAVCKKMMRLSLSPPEVLQWLAKLHAADGLATEATLYAMQYAEHLTREDKLEDAIAAFRSAHDMCGENVKALEKLADVHVMVGEKELAARVLIEAAGHYERLHQGTDAERVRARAEQVVPGISTAPPPEEPAATAVHDFGAWREPDGAVAAAPTGGMVSGYDPGDGSSSIPSIAEISPPSDALGPPPVSERMSASPDVTGAAATAFDPPQPHVEEIPDASPPAPAGLQFEPPAGTGEVETLLAEAERQFRAGNRERASECLMRAAQGYDALGRHDHAVTLYRNLGKSPHASADLMEAWLVNCLSRGDRAEAAAVACEIGDRALNTGDSARAREWFERALSFDDANALARRRLDRMASAQASPAPGAAPAGAAPAESDGGRVEVALGRAEAVSLDLGSLIAEFQRNVEAQLSGDAQSHYDLGMTYREMGLLEQAIDSFQTSRSDARFTARCAEMIGRCMLDEGRFDDAVKEFNTAIDAPGVASESRLNLRFQLALAHEAAGRPQDALVALEQVYAAQPNYPEVAGKIRALRRTLESV